MRRTAYGDADLSMKRWRQQNANAFLSFGQLPIVCKAAKAKRSADVFGCVIGVEHNRRKVL
ncbi:hypothetical protein [Janthinobacterium violaceinigrum]|uniref:Uncharacterized protein n=1 Tax=Janthinobacterium violaceinigrum TaxID=2654252 RepID=A0A6I1HRB0_9BURK|nr:hypothetical protein [Janthinobacterium violaceinigrum]KAB8061075.1 hypothetical protein GCN75_24040 [Janthinobacterium violaceinigrum]